MSRILIVEDSPTQAEQLRFSLEAAGYDVEAAGDAEGAGDLLEYDRFDLVVSDIMLPGATGYELCERIKSDPEREVPVVLLSTLSDPLAVIRALQCGADNFLTKPYEPAQLVSRIRTALSNRKLRSEKTAEAEIPVMFLGQTFTIGADREQILDLLMSTFEEALRKNAELESKRAELAGAKSALENYARELEARVDARTAELRKSQAQLSEAQRIAQVGHWHFEIDHQSIEWSDQMYCIFDVNRESFEPTLENACALLRPDDGRHFKEAIDRAIADGSAFQLECGLLTPSGEERQCWITGSAELGSDGQVKGLFGVAQDITERKHMEAQALEVEERLYQAQKMEAIGQLTGGISHDFNNLLAVIVANLELTRESVTDTEALTSIDEALDAALRGADLTQRLLAFAKRQSLQPEPIDVNRLITATCKLLSRALGERIQLSLSLEEDLPTALIDPAQLESAITNLALNARDAMPAGGSILLATRKETVGEPSAAGQAVLAPADYVVVEVTDTGTGMPPEIIEQACQPFFTTKEVGKGSGLGLSMVLGFMQQSGGALQIASEFGKGTTMTLSMPASAVRPEGVSAAAGPTGASGGETVLAVEDNRPLRSVLVRQLKSMGYTALEADSGEAAIKILRSDQHVDLLLTDVVMPGAIDGRQLAEEAVKLRPEMKVVLTSGFSETALENGVDGRILLQKPYRREDLAKALESVLGGS
jgi:signal transduction histidine kinase/DNA-binding response OmpR family regulator